MSQVLGSLANEFEYLENVRNLEDWSLRKAFNEGRHDASAAQADDGQEEVVRVKERVSLSQSDS